MGSNSKSRVVLQFNEMDFRHRRALDILRQRPRSMSELVVNAILHYTSCPEAANEFLSEIKSLCKMLEAKDKRISDLEEKLSDALEQNKLGRKKRFVRSSEQARLLNNRDKDVRAEEKSDYDDGSNAPI